MLIDTHCHLTDERYTDIGKVVREAHEAGVENMILPTADLEDAKKAIELAEKFNLYCMTGIHPENVDDLFRLPRSLHGGQVARNDRVIDIAVSELREMALSSKRVVGIGEIGLDFYWDKEKKTKERQMELFIKEMNLAAELGFPAAIHMREAEEEMNEALEKIKKLPGGQFHCFAGSEKFLKKALSLGFYISFCGNITYKSAGRLRDLLHLVPLDRLLLETDSPYLPPEPLRGTVNSPANVKIEAEFVARELGMTTEKLAEATSENAKCLYFLEN